MIIVKISQNFIKSPLKFWFISQISVHGLWHVCMIRVKLVFYPPGSHTVKLKRHVKESVQWARLEDVGDRNVRDFIGSLQDKTVTPDPLYLFDWNLPFYCPDLVQELIIPKYFAGLFKDNH